MKIRMSSLSSLLGVFMVPLLAFAHEGKDCFKHPYNPNCGVDPKPEQWGHFGSAVAMPEHWGSLESLGFCALVLIVFWAMIRLKVLRLSSKI